MPASSSDVDVVGAPSALSLARVKAMTRRQWWVVVLVGVAAAAGAAGYAEQRPPKYEASETIYTGTQGAIAGETTSVSFPDPTVYGTGPQAVEAAAAAAGLPMSKIDLTASLGPDGTEVIINATEPGVDEAVRAVEAASKAFASSWATELDGMAGASDPQLAALDRQLQSLTSQYNKIVGSKSASSGSASRSTVPTTTPVGAGPLSAEIQVVNGQISLLYSQQLQYKVAAESVRPAQTGTPPVSTVSAGKTKLVLIALGAGLLAGCGLGLARDLARDRLSDPSELPSLSELPVLAELPTARLRRKRPLVESFDGRLGEAVRELRTTITLASQRGPLNKLLVTSAANGEGKSFTAANLAIAWALSGARTVLVSSDLRHPSVTAMLGVPNSQVGLTKWLGERRQPANGDINLSEGDITAIEKALQATVIENLSVLPSGTVSANPAELLGSQGMANVVEQLCRHFDMVIFDSPPVLAVADALVLSRYADGVLFVVASEQSSKGNVQRALALLERSRANTLGVVLNRAARSGLRSYQYANYYPPKTNGTSKVAIEARSPGPPI